MEEVEFGMSFSEETFPMTGTAPSKAWRPQSGGGAAGDGIRAAGLK